MTDTGMTAPVFWQYGPLTLTDTVVTTWGVMLFLVFAGYILGRRLKDEPGPAQTSVEGTVIAIEEAIEGVLPGQARRVLPFIMALWVFLVTANLVGIIPGLHSPTRDLSCTSALALLVFLATHWFGIRIAGPKNYLRHYLTPSPVMLPFEIISEISRTVALAVRLFGNIMSMEMIALLLLMIAGFLVPVPLLLLHVVEALLQAYIFGMLALIYIAGGIQSQQITQQHKEREK